MLLRNSRLHPATDAYETRSERQRLRRAVEPVPFYAVFVPEHWAHPGWHQRLPLAQRLAFAHLGLEFHRFVPANNVFVPHA